MLVQRVSPSSQAERAGVRPGMRAVAFARIVEPWPREGERVYLPLDPVPGGSFATYMAQCRGPNDLGVRITFALGALDHIVATQPLDRALPGEFMHSAEDVASAADRSVEPMEECESLAELVAGAGGEREGLRRLSESLAREATAAAALDERRNYETRLEAAHELCRQLTEANHQCTQQLVHQEHAYRTHYSRMLLEAMALRQELLHTERESDERRAQLEEVSRHYSQARAGLESWQIWARMETEDSDPQLQLAMERARVAESALDTLRREVTCPVCMERRKNVVLRHTGPSGADESCNHMLCSECAARCGATCPECRKAWTEAMRVFM